MLKLAPSLTEQSLNAKLLDRWRVEARRRRRRDLAAMTVLLIGTVLWCAALTTISSMHQALPWYVSLGAIATFSAQHVARQKFQDYVSMPLAFGRREPLSLLETWSLSFLTVSIIFALLALACTRLASTADRKTVQMVEIELCSAHDFADRHSPLSGTQIQKVLHKRESSRVNSQGQPFHQAQIAQPSTPTNATKSIATKVQPASEYKKPQRQTAPKDVSITATQHIEPTQTDMVIIQPPQAERQPVRPRPVTKPNQQTAPLMEEVQPPEMVEMLENDGAQSSPNVFLNGGNSAHGTGAANPLSTYLKELHKRIKDKWAPPLGQPHVALLLFRVRADGKLVFIQVTHSSGNQVTDAAAVTAIVEAASGYKLPSESKLPFLDIQYKFNYLVDELKELK